MGGLVQRLAIKESDGFGDVRESASTKFLVVPHGLVPSRLMPALNQKLRGAGLPELRLDLPPQQQAGGEDEE